MCLAKRQAGPGRPITAIRAIGLLTAELVARVLESKRHPEQGFRSCLGIIRLGKTYGGERVEAAARRTLDYRKYSSMSLASILETGLDSLPDLLAEPPKPPLDHPNIRGTNYFDPPSQEDPFC